MFAMAWRTVSVRVLSDAVIVFKPKEKKERKNIDEKMNAAGRIAMRLREGWNRFASSFAWADKGRWETSDATDDEDTARKANCVRIGFEPLFVDFTQSGAWFVVFTLAEVGNFDAFVSMGLEG